MLNHIKLFQKIKIRLLIISFIILLQACSPKQEKEKTNVQAVSVITIEKTSPQTEQKYSGMLEGINNIEIRPQAEGYLEKIFVDEGAYIQKGQPLFLINDKPYTEQLNQASASLQTAQANLEKAQIEVERLEKLVNGKVISEVQLKNARAELNAVKASILQSEAAKKRAIINKDFTLIKAPVSGYIGKLPYRVGSLVGHNETQPLTVLSDISTIYAYFSMSEEAFLQFKQKYPGNTIDEKIKRIPPVTLLLPDNSIYNEKGKVDLVQGQFDKSTAAITFRASFPNPGGLLRSGNTGRITLSQNNTDVIQIPQVATFELQNKVMAYLIGKDNKLRSVSLKIAEKDALNYIISDGLKAGDRIVAKGLERLQEGITVKPLNP
ncbi:efflux RND transporter periplasmic adaptor subunit [Pedobacter nutrimenti]|uniref:efflux RND transporter periplasmic adaptor subunit n=1 Tax=Pedobacter nutrimenti TaxID=1241337 RepID=UPI00292CBA32|nr:efflux RND transporter periplasmic adaptor subunit [Pedobacter nutrimenti]